MSKISSLHALEILDSRGNPTIEVILTTDKNIIAKAKVPSGASTGEHEALELRDNDPKRYLGKGVLKAVKNVNTSLNSLLKGESVFDQEKIDKMMIEKDGTDNKSTFGANATVGVSIAVIKAAALTKKMEIYKYLKKESSYILPCPMMNIINGGAHADNCLEIQEFMIRPVGAPSFKEALRWGSETFHTLKKILKDKGFATSVGDEGGFAPNLKDSDEALSLITQAIEKAGYKPKDQISIALDVAASEFFDEGKKLYIEKKKKKLLQPFFEKSAKEMVDYYESLLKKYPIDTIEDGLDENDWEGWKYLTEKLGKKIQLVGDDIFVTNPKFVKKAIKEKVANSVLIKLNQIGTVTETIDTVKLAQENNYKTVISHRSAETEDTFIADFCVALNGCQIKTGSLSRSERIAKYNRLLEIEDELKEKVIYYHQN